MLVILPRNKTKKKILFFTNDWILSTIFIFANALFIVENQWWRGLTFRSKVVYVIFRARQEHFYNPWSFFFFLSLLLDLKLNKWSNLLERVDNRVREICDGQFISGGVGQTYSYLYFLCRGEWSKLLLE